jgi:hypothetical protein
MDEVENHFQVVPVPRSPLNERHLTLANRATGASALDPRLSARALNAIRRTWGPRATRGDLVATDAYMRLRLTSGIGEATVAEIERIVIAWALPGLGGAERKHRIDEEIRKRLRHRQRLRAVLRDLGVRDVLLELGEVCAEIAARYTQRAAGTSGRRRDRWQQIGDFHRSCEEHLRRCAADAPAKRPP